MAGACGVAAGTPLAILGAIGRAARAGAIVKGGRHLEELSTVDTVVFDKTGTLTLGTPMVTAIEPAVAVTETELLTLIASAERPSEHPLGKAIVMYAATRHIDLERPRGSPMHQARKRTVGGRVSWSALTLSYRTRRSVPGLNSFEDPRCFARDGRISTRSSRRRGTRRRTRLSTVSRLPASPPC